MTGARLGRRIAFPAIAALVILTLSGCSNSSEPDLEGLRQGPLESVKPAELTTPAPVVVAYGGIAVHESADRYLLAEAEPSAGSRLALATGALGVNDLGCFGLGNGDGTFTPIVFPYGTTIAADGAGDAIEFDGVSFGLGDDLALGGGYGGGSPGFDDRPGQEALEICGVPEGAFLASDTVQLLSDFEREMAELREQ